MDPVTGEVNPNFVYTQKMKRSIDLVLECDGTSPDFCPSGTGTGLADTPLRPLPMAPDPKNDANRVYVVSHPRFGTLCVMTSPVDAAEIVKKLRNDARVEAFVLNAT